MELKAITGDSLTVELNPWEAAWLAQALRAAEASCFGSDGTPYIEVLTDKGDVQMQRAALIGYIFAGMATTFEAAGAAAVAEAARENATGLDEMRTKTKPARL